MSQLLSGKAEQIKSQLEEQFSTRLMIPSNRPECYPDLFELWTLFNVVKALAGTDSASIYSVNSHMDQGVIPIIGGDIRPSGNVRGANTELIGRGMAPTMIVSSNSSNTSIWYDKYVGVSLDGEYWPRPDIVIRTGAYEVLKSVKLETRAKNIVYAGGYEMKRGYTSSETVKGWRSLSELLQGDPKLREFSNELGSNFTVRRELISVFSIEDGEVQAIAGRPSEELPSDRESFVYGNVQDNNNVIYWARRKSFVQPSKIVECKSGLLTPHAIGQLLTYRRLLPKSQLIVPTTRMPDGKVVHELLRHNIQIIPPPESLGEHFSSLLSQHFKEVGYGS